MSPRLIFIMLIYLFSSGTALALTPEEQQRVLQQNIQTQQRLETERQNLIRGKEIEEIDNIGKTKKEQEIQDKKTFREDGTCKVAKRFILKGSNKFSSWWIKRNILKKYQNKCLTKTDLKKIRDEIQEYYIARGYILSRVYFLLVAIDLGDVEILVEEGKLENIELKDGEKEKLPEKLSKDNKSGSSWRRKSQIFTAFPLTVGDVVNLRDIEQGIEQMNRLSSNDAVMNIEPGNKEGYSKIVVNNKVTKSTKLEISVDNSGDKNTGRVKTKAALNQDNLFGINDNLYINYSLTNPSDKKEHYSKSTYITGSVPFGYWTFGGSYSYSEYLVTTQGATTSFRSTGNSENKSYYLDRVLKRGQKYKISLKAELEENDNDSYLEDTYLPINSRELTSTNFYLNNIFYTKFGSIYLQPKYFKGLDTLGALKDGDNLTASDPRAQYNIYGLFGQLNTNFNVPKTEFPINYKLTFDSQKSEDSLYPVKQFAIGGRYTVRGFQNSSISGDNGYYIRNDLETGVLNLIPQKVTAKLSSVNNILAKTKFGVFYDYGAIRNKVLDDPTDKGYMSGAGAKVNYSGKYLSWDLSYAKALHSPEFVRTQYKIKEDQVLYFTVSVALGV